MIMLIVLDKVLFQSKSEYFFYFSIKTFIVGNTHLKQVLLYIHKYYVATPFYLEVSTSL